MRLSVLIISVLFAIDVSAQTPQNACNPNKKLSFGFGLGPNYSLMSADSLPDDYSLKNGAGFRFGGFMHYALKPNFVLAPKAELSFNNGRTVQTAADNTEVINKVLPISFEVLMHFHYKFGSSTFHKPYLIFGAGYKFPIKNTLGLNNDLTIDVGLGLEKVIHYYIFSPEIRYSYALMNSEIMPGIGGLKYHNLALVFNFK